MEYLRRLGGTGFMTVEDSVWNQADFLQLRRDVGHLLAAALTEGPLPIDGLIDRIAMPHETDAHGANITAGGDSGRGIQILLQILLRVSGRPNACAFGHIRRWPNR